MAAKRDQVEQNLKVAQKGTAEVQRQAAEAESVTEAGRQALKEFKEARAGD